jgi:TolB-like protein
MLTDDEIKAIARRWAERYQEDRDSEFTLQEDLLEVYIVDAIKEALRLQHDRAKQASQEL